jgi:hypothetical protein
MSVKAITCDDLFYANLKSSVGPKRHGAAPWPKRIADSTPIVIPVEQIAGGIICSQSWNSGEGLAGSDRTPNSRTAVAIDPMRSLLFLAVGENISARLVITRWPARRCPISRAASTAGLGSFDLSRVRRQPVVKPEVVRVLPKMAHDMVRNDGSDAPGKLSQLDSHRRQIDSRSVEDTAPFIAPVEPLATVGNSFEDFGGQRRSNASNFRPTSPQVTNPRPPTANRRTHGRSSPSPALRFGDCNPCLLVERARSAVMTSCQNATNTVYSTC